MTRAVFPGTFDPVTPGHLDIADRARHLFDELVILVAVNGDKQPTRAGDLRAAAVSAALPPTWQNVTVIPWRGLTADYCHRHGATVIVRGVRNARDVRHEQELAAMNESLGITTLLLPTRPALAAVSSTALRSSAYQAELVATGRAVSPTATGPLAPPQSHDDEAVDEHLG